ncbi:MAG: hypothetical protein IJX75_02190 [Clostridia bacterium]|nr:hypothetical protein [Clostridia bacterium]
MKNTRRIEMELNQEFAYMVKGKELFQEIATVIKDNFVAVYQTEGNILTMRIPNGQQFIITVSKIR